MRAPRDGRSSPRTTEHVRRAHRRWQRQRPPQSLVIGVVIALISLCPARGLRAELKPEEIYRQTLPSVMTLEVENVAGERFVGTAFLALEDGVAVTAWHVIHDARKVFAKFADDDRVEVLGVVDKDEFHDLALIKLNAGSRPRLRCTSATPAIGARAYVIGAPKGFGFSIADGLISQIQKVDGFKQYQVSCPISPGNSGGPVLNDSGEVVGVTSWSKLDAQNVNFAVPWNYIDALNPSLPVKPWRKGSWLSPSIVRRGDSSNQSGAADEPHAESGWADLQQLLQNSAGDDVTVVVRRNGQEKTFKFRVPQDDR